MPRLALPFFPLLAALVLAAACSDKGALHEPVVPGGKADVADRVTPRSLLHFGEPVHDAFTEDLELHGYLLDAAPGAVVTLDITHLGSSSKLDTTLFVFGPQRPDGGFGGEALHFDDDSSWGQLSRLRDVALAEGGRYLVVLGTYDGRGRGHYRFLPSCESGACAPVLEASCPATFADAVTACAAEVLADPEEADHLAPRDAAELCADAEPLAPLFDEVCAASLPPAYCAQPFPSFAQAVGPLCAEEAYHRLLDERCVLGARFRDLFRQDHLVVRRDDAITDAGELTALERDQVVAAMDASVHGDVTSASEALERVDGGAIRLVEIWDASAGRGFVALEYGAGDSSYGAVFHAGTTDAAATVVDGDLEGCAVAMGDAQRDCASDADCRGGLRCTGVATVLGRGQCVDTGASEPGESATCSVDTDCADGLVCAGQNAGAGLCGQPWTRGHFAARVEGAIPDGAPEGLRSELIAYGLATVDTDVWLTLELAHPAPEELQVTLTNPDGTEVVASGGSADALAGEQPVLGFSGDEAVNGTWTLEVVDPASGLAGFLEGWSLRVGSRWD